MNKLSTLCIPLLLSACAPHFPHFHMDVDLEEEGTVVEQPTDERSSADRQNDHYRKLLNRADSEAVKK